MAEFRPRRATPVATVWALIGALAVTTAAMHLAFVPRGVDAGGGWQVPWLALAAAFAAAELFVVHLHFGREAHSFALAEIPMVMGLFLLPSQELISARLVGLGVALAWHRRQPLVKLAFNLAQQWLGVVAIVLMWRAMLAGGAAYSLRGWVAAIVAVAVTDLVQAACVAAVIALRRQRWSWDLLTRGLWAGQIASLANASFGLVALDVLVTDWRRMWAVFVIAALLAYAHRAHIGLQRRHDSLAELNAFTRDLASELELDAVVRDVLQRVRALLEAERAEIALRTHFAGKPLRYVCTESGVQQAPASAVESHARREVLSVDLRGDGEPIGRLLVMDRIGDVRGFGREEQQLLEALAGHATIAVHNGRLADLLRNQVRENAHQAMHDRLTGLPNRLMFDHAVTAALATPGAAAAVLFMDLDRFKDVNDTLGHVSGDELLRAVGARLRAALPEEFCVARLGGDEFAALVPGVGGPGAFAYAEVLRAALLRPLPLGELSFSVDCSIGIALAPGHGADAEALMRRADIAMYHAKSQQTGIEVYSPEGDHHSADRLALVSDLRQALADEAFRVHYQPKTDLDDGSLGGVEALIRWTDPKRGPVRPDEFIAVAEKSGVIEEITEWVLRTAVDQCVQWQRAGLRVPISVNVSPRNLHGPGFVAGLARLLTDTGLDPELLTLEITEGAVMSDPERAIRVLRMLRDLGVRLSIDDLGVGHSSLAYLRRLPVDEVKIDKSFITGMADAADDEAIVAAIIKLGHTLRMTVVAEGVEDERTWHLLRRLGCDTAQGYWMGRPMTADDFETWIPAWNARRPQNLHRPVPMQLVG
jgi:diguanylate cyclase (GGDEF)-like protein